ncbi:MAG: hypothetical protein ACI32N_00235 [Bulleidia sp.]
MYNRRREIEEAIFAGESALNQLKDAKSHLDSASNWGLVDMFGGNFISGFLKHNEIDHASDCVERARRELERFRDELADIRDVEGLNIQIDSFLVFADYLFDGLFADIFVQSKISDYKKQVNAALDRVQDILFVLRDQL